MKTVSERLCDLDLDSLIHYSSLTVKYIKFVLLGT